MNIPTPPSEKLIHKIDARDRLMRVLEVVALLIIMGINIFGLFQIESIIKTDQAGTVAARQANKDRQQQITDYIKCLVLLRYDAPTLGPQSTRAETEAALDKCAQQ